MGDFGIAALMDERFVVLIDAKNFKFSLRIILNLFVLNLQSHSPSRLPTGAKMRIPQFRTPHSEFLAPNCGFS
jgi:hypothetical protein